MSYPYSFISIESIYSISIKTLVSPQFDYQLIMQCVYDCVYGVVLLRFMISRKTLGIIEVDIIYSDEHDYTKIILV